MTQELILTRGLPGAGKTTRALAWLTEDPENRARVNRDDLRAGIFGQTWPGNLSRKGEVEVSSIQRRLVRHLLDAGRSVVVDNTHLNDPAVEYWRQTAVKYEVGFVVWDMRDVDVETCVARDLTRASEGGRWVTETVIRKMHERQAASWQT